MNPHAASALRAAIAMLGADSGTVHVRDGDRPLLRLAAWQGAMPEPVLAVIREIPWGKGMAGLAAERGEPVESCNLQTTTSADVRPGARTTGLGGSAVVPMFLGDEVVGTLGVGCQGERRFTAAETDALLAAGRALARRLAPPPLAVLRAELAKRLDAGGREWLDGRLAAAERGQRDAVIEAFPEAARRLGRGPLGCPGALVVDGGEIPLRAWRIDDAGRVALLLALGGDGETLARELYFAGDLRERVSALRALAVLGRDEGGLEAVRDACRANAAELVEAAMAENPYAARVLPAPEFRAAVLKCAFLGIALERVAALEARVDPELTAMLVSYVTEREVAGRSVPPDVWPVLARAPTPGLVAKLLGYLEHPADAHRAAAAAALARIGDPRARVFVEDRLAREPNAAVRRALERAHG